MFLDTRPASLGADGNADAWSAFRVDDPAKRWAAAPAARRQRAGDDLSASDGTSYTTTLWAWTPRSGG
jgi:hypothetical protein